MTAPGRFEHNVVTGRFDTTRAAGSPSTIDSSAMETHEGEATDYLEAAIELGYRPLPSRRDEVSDAYWDTAAFDLLRAGFALRFRGIPLGVHVALKSLDRPGFDDTESQRVQLGGPVEDVSRPLDPASWPDAIGERVRAVAGEAPRLVPICVLRKRSDNITLVNDDDGDGPAVAELSLVVVAVFDPSAIALDDTLQGVARLLEDGAPIVTHTELELEPLTVQAPAVLSDLAGRLRAIPGFSPATGSTLEEALRVLVDHTPGAGIGRLGIFHGMPMAEAGRLMWRRQLLALLLNEAGARRGEDPEYVHDMRVATRRARAVARVFGPFFRRNALSEHLTNLRRTARALGAVRDADVALLKLRKYARTRPDVEQQGLAEIRAVWRVERRQANRELLEWLDSPDYRSFVAGFATFCRTAGQGARAEEAGSEASPTPSDVGHVMPSAILNRFEQVRAYERLFESSEPITVTALHALRIDCKALRYSLEPVEHLLGEEGSEIVQQLKGLQDLLGDLNDAVVADGRLAELGDAVEPTALETYRAELQSILAELVSAVPEAWRNFVAPDNRRLLAVAIARL